MTKVNHIAIKGDTCILFSAIARQRDSNLRDSWDAQTQETEQSNGDVQDADRTMQHFFIMIRLAIRQRTVTIETVAIGRSQSDTLQN